MYVKLSCGAIFTFILYGTFPFHVVSNIVIPVSASEVEYYYDKN